MKIIAHRGASGLAPENTLSAFQMAIDIGVDMIELDVRETADREVVVFHDPRLKRLTDSRGMVKRLSLEELKNLNVGGATGDDTMHKIPSLEEAIDLIKGDCEILVEIKSEGRRVSTTFLRNLFRLIYRHKVESSVVLQSFDTHVLTRIHRLDPNIRVQKLIVLKIPLLGIQLDKRVMLENVLKKEHYEAINVDHRFVTPLLIQKIHRTGKQIFTWTVNSEDRMGKLIDLGVDGIITNYPNKLNSVLKERKLVH